MKQGSWVESSEWVSIVALYLDFVVSTERMAGSSQRGSMEYWQIAFGLTDGLSAASVHLRS